MTAHIIETSSSSVIFLDTQTENRFWPATEEGMGFLFIINTKQI